MTTSSKRRSYEYFAVCPLGAETMLGEELKRLRFGSSEAQVGGAKFTGPLSEGYRAVLWLRSAVRIYREVGRFKSDDAEGLYRGALLLPWEELLTPDTTFAVDAKTAGSNIQHSGYAALKVKDAVADRLRQKFGSRPSVDTQNPTVRIFAHIGKVRTVVSVDLGGRPLNRRGYRVETVEAPISECLAAAAVTAAQWDEKTPFLDPMCGSGTILIEAAMKAANIPPGLVNPDFAFTGWPDFDSAAWEKLLKTARDGVKIPPKLIMQGFDADPAAVEAAKANAKAAGVDGLIKFERADVADFSPKPGWGAVVVSNPPYGKRLEDPAVLQEFFRKLGTVLISRCKGYKIHLFVPDPKLVKATMLKPDHYHPFSNGGLDVRLYSFSIRG